MVSEIIIGVAAGAIGIATAAAYAYTTDGEASASVDVDDDGTDEATINFGGGNEHQPADGIDIGVAADDVEKQADPTPEVVKQKDSLEDVTGVGPTRATSLRDEGYDTPEDLYYASDSNLESVHGIGQRAVENIRSDIGSVEGNSGESVEEPEEDSLE